ncbi:MAG: AAA family ATPase [Candidatus Riflebacteria bacterium]|nr:AAA family ATPase [Candidatus Riflebacteria bacterium]
MSKAEFPISLKLPDGDAELLGAAGEAVRQEYRDSVRWKRLRCRKVSRLTGVEDGIFIVEVGHTIDLDWTWEGAVAFRPAEVRETQGDISQIEKLLSFTEDYQSGKASHSTWIGEVVEIDETNGKIFVYIADPAKTPCAGTFYIRPFDFLFHLNSVYNHSDFTNVRSRLPERLNACQGGINSHPNLSADHCLEELRQLWSHAWSFMWGPPGTGKTTTIGKQVAANLPESTGRILVVSTTNRATDEVALAIGRFAKQNRSSYLSEGKILRIGKSAGYARYRENGLVDLLKGTETDLLHQISVLQRQLQGVETPEERAVIRKDIQELMKKMKSSALENFISPDVQVVVATVFKAISLLNDETVRDLLGCGKSCFTTIIIDEAGLISRAAGAVLSLLGSHRVMFVGDPKQLAPISRVSRILPTNQAVWLGSSTLNHLQSTRNLHGGVHLLKEQYRMNPEISKAISHYQYDGSLRDSQLVVNRHWDLPQLIKDQPRTIWCVLDEEDDLPSIRPERGPGHRSWKRPVTRKILKRFFSDDSLKSASGIFISPFRAQAKDIAQFFIEEGYKSWTSATIHSFQGTEAEVVILDTVNAGSCGWSTPEWKRLINVGLSRGKEFAMILASRAEMNQIYLKPLLPFFKPRFLRERSGRAFFETVDAEVVWDKFQETHSDSSALGSQIVQRKLQRPVLSREQQKLCGYRMDGKPRLVRGVAGSGKTYVLAHWLGKTINSMRENSDARFFAVYANASLKQLIQDTIATAWEKENPDNAFPWDSVTFMHVKELLDLKLPEIGLRLDRDDFDYDRAAADYLQRKRSEDIQPICDAVFIDEAQDMGPNTLKLISYLVKQSDPADPNSKSVNIFYDNAQNIYERATPKWSEMGLDMRGRSTVMEESFRSTRPISEFALNVLYSIQSPESDPDYRELLKRGLVEKTRVHGCTWWKVRFNQIEGPQPVFKKFANIEDEFNALGDQLVHWIKSDGVKPRDISILYIGRNIPWRIEQQVAQKLKPLGVQISHQTSRSFERDERSILVTTPHSFKGFETEIVIVAGVDQFYKKGKGILCNTLYVAITRARSILYVYGKQSSDKDIVDLFAVFDRTLDLLVRRPDVQFDLSPLDDFEDIAMRIGKENRNWLEGLWHDGIQQEPIVAADGEILAEPLFWFKNGKQLVCCFERDSLTTHIRNRIEDGSGRVIFPGDSIELNASAASRANGFPYSQDEEPVVLSGIVLENQQVRKKPEAKIQTQKNQSGHNFYVVKPDRGCWLIIDTRTNGIYKIKSDKDAADMEIRALNSLSAPVEKSGVCVVEPYFGGWRVVNSVTQEIVMSYCNTKQTALDRAEEENRKRF